MDFGRRWQMYWMMVPTWDDRSSTDGATGTPRTRTECIESMMNAKTGARRTMMIKIDRVKGGVGGYERTTSRCRRRSVFFY